MNNFHDRVFLCGLLAVVGNLSSPTLDTGVAAISQGLPSVMGSRIILNLREVAYKQRGPSTAMNISALRFAQQTIRRQRSLSACTLYGMDDLHTRNGAREAE